MDGILQERRNSSVLAMELGISLTNQSKCSLFIYIHQLHRH